MAKAAANHVSLSALEEELLRARELESSGKEHVDAQERRVESLRAENIDNPQSERLLDVMRVTHHLQGSHVRLLEREVREEQAKKKSTRKPSAVDTANQYRQNASASEVVAVSLHDRDAISAYVDIANQWRHLAEMTERIEREKLKTRW